MLRVSFPPRDVRQELEDRGVDDEAISEILPELARELSNVNNLNALIDYCFDHPSAGRFSDGTFGVFYSALEEETAIAEKRYHASAKAAEDGLSRTFVLMRCFFDGEYEELVGQEEISPYLVADDGYPACCERARESIARGVQCFLTGSARRPGGVCSPVFVRSSLTGPVILRQVVLVRQDGGWMLI